MLPKDFPPSTTVQGYSTTGERRLVREAQFELLLQARAAAGAKRAVGGSDRQLNRSETTESGGPRGNDAAKKIKGRKRYIVTDTGGLLVGAEVIPPISKIASGGVVIEAIDELFPGCAICPPTASITAPTCVTPSPSGNWTVEIVKRAADAAAFSCCRRRWVVERSLAWLNRNRCLAKDFEGSIASAKAWV